MKGIALNKSGFTLAEILVAVLVMSVLVTMAVPMYERAIEKSRFAEVGITLKRLGESKLRTMDTYEIGDFQQNSFNSRQLDVQIPANSEFAFRLYPQTSTKSVCAERLRGENAGTIFLYVGEEGIERCSDTNHPAWCEYYAEGEHLFCQNSPTAQTCKNYGMNKSVIIGNCLNATGDTF